VRAFLIILLVFAGVLGIAALYTRWQTRVIEARYPPAGQMIDVDDVRLHFTDLRPDLPEKGTVLLIHGASGNEAEMRKALAPQLLQRGYRVISIDRPGQGWSTRPANTGAAGPDSQASLIRRAMEKHGVLKALVGVHSLAGAIGLQLALDHAGFVQGLLLVSPVSHPWPGGIALYYTLSASQVGSLFNHTLALPLGQLLMSAAVHSVFAPQAPPPNQIENIKLPLVLRPAAFGHNATDVASLYAFVKQQAPRYRGIRLPVAIISGSADTIVLTDIHSRSSAREIRGATLTILPGVGHAPHWSHTANIVAEFEKLFIRVSKPPDPAAPARRRD